jgi:NADH dehydrogenase FAD-containing subunit
VGGGATGVELVGAIAELAKRALTAGRGVKSRDLH